MSLFPRSAQQGSRHIVEFKAGKCLREGTTNTVKADTRKGLIYMDQTSDSLMHFYWKDRTTGTVEDDLIIFPDDSEFIRAKECTTGRVYVLKFKSSSQRLFFWMQDKLTDKDDERVKMVNLAINNPEEAVRKARELHQQAQRDEDSGRDDDDALAGFRGMDQESLMQLLQSHGAFQSAAAAAAVAGTESSSGLAPTISRTLDVTSRSGAQSNNQSSKSQANTTGAISSGAGTSSSTSTISNSLSTEQINSLGNILQNITVPEDQPVIELNLGDVLTPSALEPLLNDNELRLAIFPHLSETSKKFTSEEIENEIHSEKFKNGLKVLNYAVSSGQLESILSLLGIEGASSESSVGGLLKAIEEEARRREENKKRDENSDKMDTD